MLSLDKVISLIERQDKYCWTLFLRSGGGKQTVAKFPPKGEDSGELDKTSSIETLRETVEDFADEGETRFEIVVKRTPKSNGDEVSTWQFKSGQSMAGLGGMQGLGAIGQMFPLLQAQSQHQRELLEVIAQKQLLDYRTEELRRKEADFEAEMKRKRAEFEAETKELREKWENTKDAMKEGMADVAPDAIKGILGFFKGDAPDAKPLAGAEAEQAQPSAEDQVIIDLADWLQDNVKNIYDLRQINAAVKSPEIRRLAKFLVVEIPDDEGVRGRIRASVENMVNKMKEQS